MLYAVNKIVFFHRMVSSSVIATVSTTNELQEHLKNDQDTFVAYIEGKDSTGFC